MSVWDDPVVKTAMKPKIGDIRILHPDGDIESTCDYFADQHENDRKKIARLEADGAKQTIVRISAYDVIRRFDKNTGRLNVSFPYETNRVGWPSQSKAVSESLEWQRTKWGPQNHPPGTWLFIIMEELGEVAKAVNERDIAEAQYEIIQTIACLAQLHHALFSVDPATGIGSNVPRGPEPDRDDEKDRKTSLDTIEAFQELVG